MRYIVPPTMSKDLSLDFKDEYFYLLIPLEKS
jgi:hypothetical protein